MIESNLKSTRRARFRHWRRTRPFWGGLWAVLGGLLMLVGPLTAIKVILVAGQVVWMGITVGAAVSIFGLFLWFAPSQRQMAGVLIVILSLVSFITSDFGGFLIGMILGLTGGAMGFAWVARPAGVVSNPAVTDTNTPAAIPAAPAGP